MSLYERKKFTLGKLKFWHWLRDKLVAAAVVVVAAAEAAAAEVSRLYSGTL